jgi:hypothetical protein
MKKRLETKAHYLFPIKTIVVIGVILSIIVLTTSAFKDNNIAADFAGYENVNADSAESVKAFLQVYKVLMSPRCMNCHPAGDQPLQGDDSRLHAGKFYAEKMARVCMLPNVQIVISPKILQACIHLRATLNGACLLQT